MFHVKHLSKVLHSANEDHLRTSSLEAEVYKNLVPVLMQIQSIYGEFWEEIMTSLAHSWSSLRSVTDESLPVLYASLKLYASLEKLSSGNLEEVNDDFRDGWKENESALTSSLISLVKILSGEYLVSRMCTGILKMVQSSEMSSINRGEWSTI